MDTGTFARLSRLCGACGSRRAVLGAVLGTALLETSMGTAAAKPEPPSPGTSPGKSRRHGTRRGKHKGHVQGQAKTKSGNHCISPSTGADLNEFFGISAQIVTGFCAEVGAGEPWTTGGPWFMAQRFEAVPEGFTPVGTTPLEDFIAKFTALKLVIDPGTHQETIVVFPHDGNLFVDPDFNGAVFVSPTTLGLLNPEPVGEHEVAVSWVFSAMHCDGIAANIAQNCFPAGETHYFSVAFAVTPGHH